MLGQELWQTAQTTFNKRLAPEKLQAKGLASS